MDPVTATLALTAGKSVIGGAAASAEARGERQRAKINAEIARTRAIQTDTVERQNLESELGTARAAFGANEQRMNVGVLEVLNDIRTVRGRERRISVENENTRAADFRTQARNFSSKSRFAMNYGLIKAAPSIYDLTQV